MKETLEDIRSRRSVRSYKPEQICEAELDTILEAGTWAPSGHGAQSAKIVVVQDKAIIAELEKLNIAVLGTPNAKPFYGAPTCIVVFADTSRPTWIDDGNMVIATLMLAATAINIGSCYIYRAKESFESEAGKAFMKKWELPDTYKAVGNVILGYASETPAAKPRKHDYILKITR